MGDDPGRSRDEGESDIGELLAELARAPEVIPLSLLVGTTLGRYRVEAILGRGGMGVVYRAHDSVLGRAVALKVLPPELLADADRKKRLFREARAAASLNHPNVVTIHDVVEDESRAFVVMELVEGKPLRDFVGKKDVALTTRIGWLSDIARALAAAHKAGVVHRDVKPENVLIANDGVVKVVDFGIARSNGAADAAHASTMTKAGVLLGTPRYMAPEQLDAEPVDGRTDQFAWGVVGYELLVGRSPWGKPGDPTSAVLRAILTADPPAPHLEDSAIPREVSAVILRALAKKKEERFGSLDDARAALASAAAGKPSSVRTAPRAVREPARLRGRVATIGALVIAASGTAWLATRSAAQKTELPEAGTLASVASAAPVVSESARPAASTPLASSGAASAIPPAPVASARPQPPARAAISAVRVPASAHPHDPLEGQE